MDFNPRGRHYKSSNISSPEAQHADDEEDDEESRRIGSERQPVLSQRHRRIHNASSSAPPELSTPSYTAGGGEVIVKIADPADPLEIESSKNTTSDHDGKVKVVPSLREERENLSLTEEFSFRRPDDAPTIQDDGRELEAQARAPTPSQEEQGIQQEPQDLAHRRLGQGLPPLPLARDGLTRQSWSRNPSEIQSPDLSAYSSYRNALLQQNPTCTSMNFDGSVSREIRVSFQESVDNSGRLKRRPSLYSTVDPDSSSSSGDDEDYHEEERVSRGGHASGEMWSNSGTLRRLSITRVKSRLMDPPSTPLDQRSGNINKSGALDMRSGALAKSNADEDEDDPFFEDDIPEELKRAPISPFVVIEWVSLVAICGALICTLVIPALDTEYFWKMKLWKWEVMILVLICGRLVSGWAIRIIVFFIERNFLLRKRVLYFVYGLKGSAQMVLWFGLVLVTWFSLFDKRVEREARSEPLKIITKLLIIAEVCALLWLLKTLIVKVCASTFHVNAFFDRIQEAVFNQFVIETLSGPPCFELQLAQEEGHDVQMLQDAGINLPPNFRATMFSPHRTPESGNIDPAIGATPMRSPIGYCTSPRHSSAPSKKQDHHDQGITIDDLHKLNQRNVSAWNMKRLMKIVRKSALMTTLDEQMIHASQGDEHARQIMSEVQAKAAARKIFRNVAKPHARYIYLDDLRRFMREDEAINTINLFDGVAETHRISKRALKDWVVKAFRERRALSLTLSDTKTAVNKLHKMVNVVVVILIIIIVATYLNIITSQSIVFLCSQIVLVAFVFGNTCKNIFESIIFLFVIHPFDVGDRCEIDGIQMVVEEMNILTTIFLRYDNLKVIFPNYVLLSKPINNFYQSPDMGDGVEFSCPIATPPEKIALMRERILSYIQNKKEHWHPQPLILLKDVESLHTLRMAVWLQHKMNHQDMGQRWVRRALLVEECVKIFKELDIEYRFYPVGINTTNSMPPLPPSNHPLMPSPTSPSPFADHGSKDVVHP
ncbi:hypothetical protein Cgig2_008859 [Carnegiea gigantea]|uniref:Mechanosensitive ion channel protein n=1 Tax=Carnegiea gigantea TaxID=171969 RepID=A0A9Q1JN96_9CARY|nr:hypothetical protein Cgig2_008859 [Carnegiea gigantea]